MLKYSIPRAGFYHSESAINKIEDVMGVKYMGYWDIKDKNGSWCNAPLDIFYQPNPDIKAGHSNYFAMYVQNGRSFIADGSSAFSEPMDGIIDDDDRILISRYRHDYVSGAGNNFIDGGRNYMRTNVGPHRHVRCRVIDGEFFFSLPKED